MSAPEADEVWDFPLLTLEAKRACSTSALLELEGKR